MAAMCDETMNIFWGTKLFCIKIAVMGHLTGYKLQMLSLIFFF